MLLVWGALASRSLPPRLSVEILIIPGIRQGDNKALFWNDIFFFLCEWEKWSMSRSGAYLIDNRNNFPERTGRLARGESKCKLMVSLGEKRDFRLCA